MPLSEADKKELSESEKKELMADVASFIRHGEQTAEKTVTLTMVIRGKQYAGGEIKINKPGGKGLKFM